MSASRGDPGLLIVDVLVDCMADCDIVECCLPPWLDSSSKLPESCKELPVIATGVESAVSPAELVSRFALCVPSNAGNSVSMCSIDDTDISLSARDMLDLLIR